MRAFSSSTPFIFSLVASISTTARFSYATTSNNNSSKTTATRSAFVISPSGDIHNTNTHSQSRLNSSSSSANNNNMTIDPDYPGTAVTRMLAVRKRVSTLTKEDLNDEWEEVRKKLLWAGGLKDLSSARPGQGYTGHSFNDYNHVDLTCMLDKVSHNTNDGSVKQIAVGNQLGPGVLIASLPELGEGGSWSTCMIGCNKDPPQDVAHIQFRSRIAFKLVWSPSLQSTYDTFVLVDDDGKELARGTPKETKNSRMPSMRERQVNYKLVAGSKYGIVAEQIAAGITTVSTMMKEETE